MSRDGYYYDSDRDAYVKNVYVTPYRNMVDGSVLYSGSDGSYWAENADGTISEIPYSDALWRMGSDKAKREWKKEQAKHLTIRESAGTIAGGIVIGTVAATFDPKDPVGSLRKTPRNLLCVFGIIALYAVAGVLLLMASGALEGRHYGTFGLLLVPAILLLLAGVGLIRVMMNKRFLPDPSALHPGQRKNVEAAMRLQEVNADKKPRKTVVGILLVATGVLVAALLIGMYLFAR
ncbi:MAG: hypothetical protein IJP92_12710 [Lachnospiraceae bacterium]|nr:hypothetical protein [Lachnospiraceae bacterium]